MSAAWRHFGYAKTKCADRVINFWLSVFCNHVSIVQEKVDDFFQNKEEIIFNKGISSQKKEIFS